jgi:hypothetical protein
VKNAFEVVFTWTLLFALGLALIAMIGAITRAFWVMFLFGWGIV